MSDPLWASSNVGLTARRGATQLRVSFTSGGSFFGSTTLSAVGVTAGIHESVGRLEMEALAGPVAVWGTDGRPYPAERLNAIGVMAEGYSLYRAGPGFALGVEVRSIASRGLTTIGVGPALRVKLAGGRP